MEKHMKVAKWGNSLAVRLSAALVQEIGLQENDEIEIVYAHKHQLAVTKQPGAEELLHRIEVCNVSLPKDYRFDREEANAR
jgi:antitoxin MazE